MTFQDREAAQQTAKRIELLAGLPLPEDFLSLFADNPHPDQALTNLERWLSATSSPGIQVEQLVSTPALARALLTLMGASQPLADCLIQNPELASLVFEPTELTRVPSVAGVVREGETLLSASTSYSHSLDRLRFLKQRWTLPIAVNDLEGTWGEEATWAAISDLAQAILQLTLNAAWKEFAPPKGLDSVCPVMVVGFGKLGGRELNYSSDVDLAYVMDDSLDERTEGLCVRFCEVYGRALMDRMGRGSLYRVDLRLRPYGGAGAIVRSMKSFEAYYKLYAEPWEIQALLRSRPMAGPPGLAARWQSLVKEQCFRPALSEVALDHMLAMRLRIEGDADPDDIKRGPGGIRDVEFLTQVLQLLNGYSRPSLQVVGTCDAIRALDREGLLDHAVATSLISGYTFLRQLEHRCQLVGDQQTHMVPSEPDARERLAKLMHEGSWDRLSRQLTAHRRTIQTLYQSTLHPKSESKSDRDTVAEKLAPYGQSALQWFDLLAESDAFYSSLLQNEGSLQRVRTVLAEAPALVGYFKESVALTELLMSGEIEEESEPESRVRRLHRDAAAREAAMAARNAWVIAITNWLFNPQGELGASLAKILDTLIKHVRTRLDAEFDILGLGSFGAEEMSIHSDADLVFLVDKVADHASSEIKAQQFLGFFSQIHRLGSPFAIDLRLRPEGGKGLLVRTYQGFGQYELEAMEMWERFALCQARLVAGDEKALALVRKSAFAQPLTPERLKELVAMKGRVEKERVSQPFSRREVKLGHGGLNDIEWLVHLHEMRYPTATGAIEWETMPAKIRRLGQASLINAVEVEELLEARKHLLAVRARLALMGLDKDMIPENPDKLGRLAAALGYDGGNALLDKHGRVIEQVRTIYLESLERLKA